jgi:transposase
VPAFLGFGRRLNRAILSFFTKIKGSADRDALPEASREGSSLAAASPRFHLHFTPTCASWMNMVERFFRDLNQ